MTGFEAGILIFSVFVAVSVIFFTLRTGISPMPSSMSARRAMLKLVKEEEAGTLYELGSGWGGLAVSLARRFPESRVIGYELSPVPLAYSILVARFLQLRNLTYRRTDFQNTTFEDDAHLFCYLFPGGMESLAQKLNNTQNGPVTIISHTFRLPGFEPDETIQLEDMYGSTVYRYAVGRQLESRQTATK